MAKKTGVFLLLAGCFFFSAIFLCSALLDEMDVDHPLAFETADPGDSGFVPEQLQEIIGSISVLEPTLRNGCSFPLQTQNFFSDFSSPSSETSVLRC